MVLARGRPRQPRPREEDPQGFTERVVFTRRIAKVVKGGRRLRFNALVVVGDGKGHVGFGMERPVRSPLRSPRELKRQKETSCGSP